MSTTSTISSTLYLSRLVLDPRSQFRRELFKDKLALYGKLLNTFEGTELQHHTGGGSVEKGRRKSGFLYRVEPEPDRQSGGIVVLMQSTEPPVWTSEHRELFLETPSDPKPFVIDVPAGTRLRFRLRACPTKSTPPGNEKSPGKRERGKRQPAFASVVREYNERLEKCTGREEFNALTRKKNIRIEQACADWLAARFERSGAGQLARISEPRWDDFAFDKNPNESTSLYDLRVRRELPIRQRHKNDWKQGEGDLSPVLYEGSLTVIDSQKLTQLIRQGIGPAKAFGCGLLSLARA